MTAPVPTATIEPQRAYSTGEVAALIGVGPRTVRAMAASGEFGQDGAIAIRTSGRAHRVHAYRVFGWAVTAWRRRNAIRT